MQQADPKKTKLPQVFRTNNADLFKIYTTLISFTRIQSVSGVAQISGTVYGPAPSSKNQQYSNWTAPEPDDPPINLLFQLHFLSITDNPSKF
jgi:hypothetical protein